MAQTKYRRPALIAIVPLRLGLGRLPPARGTGSELVRPGARVSGTPRVVVASGLKAAAGPGARNCSAHAAICGRGYRGTIFSRWGRGGSPSRTRRRALRRLRGAAVRRILAGQRVSLAKAGKGHARGARGPLGAWAKPERGQLRPAVCGPQPGSSPAEPREPCGAHSRAPGSSRLTCQAPGSCPISCGRSAAAAMFSTSRCQSARRRPIVGGAGGQVTAGQLAPHWRAPPGLPLGLCERSE